MKILVLGASGYIGSRLLTRMRATVGLEPVAAARGRKPLPAEVASVPVDARDENPLRLALVGMDGVVNCVAGDADSIATGAAVLARAAHAAGCRCIVHLSSMAVYGRREGLVDENAPLDPGLGWYAQAKCAAEQSLTDFASAGGSVALLRPGCVYGAGSELWVGRIGRLLRAGRLGDLGAQADGWSNLVHVDDVCTSIIASLHALQTYPASTRVAYNLAAPDSPRWNDYFLDLALAVGATPLRRLAPGRVKADACLAGPALKLAEKLADRLGIDRRGLPDPLPPALLRFFAQQILLDSRKAERELGLHWMPYAEGLTDAVLANPVR